MYQPKKYLKKDPGYIFKFIEEHPFATLVIQGERLLATHIPVLITGSPEDYYLFAHIANHNEQLQYLKDGTEALVIFQGAHSYISSSWYKEKDISTWDYSAVHVNAKVALQADWELEESLQKLITRFEKDQEKPLYFHDIPEEIVRDHIPYITGFWLHPIKVEAVAKLHQGSDKEDVERVIEHLEKNDDFMSCPLSKNIKEEHGL